MWIGRSARYAAERQMVERVSCTVLWGLFCTRYCPAVASAPTAVLTGWYSTPEDALRVATRESTVQCAGGEYCVAGVRRLCVAGKYSLDIGRSVPCTTPCPPGKGLASHSCVTISGRVVNGGQRESGAEVAPVDVTACPEQATTVWLARHNRRGSAHRRRSTAPRALPSPATPPVATTLSLVPVARTTTNRSAPWARTALTASRCRVRAGGSV